MSVTNSKQWHEFTVKPDGKASINGLPLDVGKHPDAYTAAMAWFTEEAARQGNEVLVNSKDGLTDSWFTVNAEGMMVMADAPAPASTVAAAASAPDLPTAPALPPATAPREAEAAPQAAEPVLDPVITSIPHSAPPAAPRPVEPALPARSEVRFVKPVRERPRSGMRSAVYTLTGGAMNMGLSAREQEEEDLIRRITRPITGTHNSAVLSLKGGIGKTSTTVGVGMILAEYRGDPPCVADLNPDAGDLAERALGEDLYARTSPATISDIVRNYDKINSLTTLSEYMHHANRLHVIAGEQDPALSDALNADDYFKVQRLVAQYYKIMLTDCGTGVSHPAMSGILLTADNLVIASGYAVSGAKRAKSTLDWLSAHGYEKLARNAVVVVTDKDMVSSRVNRHAIEETLAGAAKTLVVVPHDKGVADGDQISLERISRQTRLAYMQIAAAIVDGYN